MSNADKEENPNEEQETKGLLIFEKYRDLGAISTGAMVLGYWWAISPEERTSRDTLVEISTLLPFFILIVTLMFEFGGGIFMSFLAYGLKKWDEAQSQIKARKERTTVFDSLLQFQKEGKSLEEVLESMFDQIIFNPDPRSFKNQLINLNNNAEYDMISIQLGNDDQFGVDGSHSAILQRRKDNFHELRLFNLEKGDYEPYQVFDHTHNLNTVCNLVEQSFNNGELKVHLLEGEDIPILIPNIDSR